jgi:predicted Rossmann fold flavoprotein
MCALQAGKRGRRVALVEHGERPGRKILISGGGRCNFTNLHCRPENFISSNPHFAKSALARYTPWDFLELLHKHGIAYHEKKLGQLFCDGSAREILDMLLAECKESGVELFLNTSVYEVARGSDFVVRARGQEFAAACLVVASGGYSIPKLGATGLGYQLAAQFGLRIQPPRPGLVPLVFSPEDRENYCHLSGTSAKVIARCEKIQFAENLLITHRGLSGPAILQVSSYWRAGETIAIDLAPGKDITLPLRQSRLPRTLAAIRSLLQPSLGNRFAERWLELHVPGDWTNLALEHTERQIHAWEVVPSGTEGYLKAEVTAGGVDTDELSSKTMESRKVSGLFFIGEVVDVTGQLGGFNFQWAWASAVSAGQAV